MKNSTSRTGKTTNLRPGAGRPAQPPADHPVQPSKPTRRQFLVNCSAIAVTASVAPATLGGPSRSRAVPLEQIGLVDFARQFNTTFVVRPERGAPIELVLVEIRPLASKIAAPNAEDARNEKFALLFRGSLAASLRQDTYSFEHQRVGSFAMFIVPIGCMDQSHCYYEAIFNRPARASKTRTARNDTQ